MQDWIALLEEKGSLPRRALRELLESAEPGISERLGEAARRVRDRVYGRKVFIRGLIEFTSFCKNDCLYCGLRRSNQLAERYRLSSEEILECCDAGWRAGMRTFVLQGGEDAYFTRERIVALIEKIKSRHADCAVTLSIGERPEADYRAFFQAGADRYLLRHETATDAHYRLLHPPEMLLSRRMECLRQLKALGFQAGCGMMIGSPGQTVEMLVKDLEFLREFQPEMVGMGPFIPHCQTPFAHKPAGSVERTLRLLSITRLLLPSVLLPATTALSTLDGEGRVHGLNAGANVVMLNLSPQSVREKYSLYDGKAACKDDAREVFRAFSQTLKQNGYFAAVSRGDPTGKEIDNEP